MAGQEQGRTLEPWARELLRCPVTGATLVDGVGPDGELVVSRGDDLGDPALDALVEAGIKQIKVRSALTCTSTTGICGMCYGRSMATGKLVDVGEAVGIVAAQSIGEPGTQLTMRTFHIGGAAQRGAEQSAVEATSDGTVKIANRNIVANSSGAPIVMSRLDTERTCWMRSSSSGVVIDPSTSETS